MAKSKIPEKKSISGKATFGIFLAIIAVMVVIAILTDKNPGIRTIDEFHTAVRDKKAIDCVISREGEIFVLQTNDGFNKIRLAIMDESDIPEGIFSYILMIRDEGIYMWDDTRDIAFESNDVSIMDEHIDELIADIEDIESDEGYTIRCRPPSEANFIVPTDIEFINIDDEYDEYGHLDEEI